MFALGHAEGSGSLRVAPKITINIGGSCVFCVDDVEGHSIDKAAQNITMNTGVFGMFALGHAEGNGYLHVAPKPTINIDGSCVFCVDDVEGHRIDKAAQNTTMNTGVFAMSARIVARGVVQSPFQPKGTMNAVVFLPLPWGQIQGTAVTLKHCIARALEVPMDHVVVGCGHRVAASSPPAALRWR